MTTEFRVPRALRVSLSGWLILLAASLIAQSAQAMQAATRTFLSQMRNFYILTVAGIDPRGKQKDLILDVIDAGGRKRKDIVTAYTPWPSCAQ